MKTVHITSTDLVTKIDDDTVARARALRAKGITPHLAVVAVGDAAQSPFIRVKQERGRSVGVEVSIYRLPDKIRSADVESIVTFANDDPELSGLIIQLPLPASVATKERDRLLGLVRATKDVDALGAGATKERAASLAELQKRAVKAKTFVPTTAAAMLSLALHVDVDLSKSVVVVGKGVLVGTPLHVLLRAIGIRHQWVDKTDAGYTDKIKAADVVFTGTDTMTPFLTKRSVKEGAVLIAAGNEINYDSVEGHAAAVTAKIGSLGPLTVSLLMNNTVAACEWQQ